MRQGDIKALRVESVMQKPFPVVEAHAEVEEVSAFISRGNDHPGNFSHVAIVHVDSNTEKASP